MQDPDSVGFKVTQIKMNFYSYHQDAQDNIICVPPSVKVSYLPRFISGDNFFPWLFLNVCKTRQFHIN